MTTGQPRLESETAKCPPVSEYERLVEQWRRFAQGLEREVHMGIAVRQSVESKLARAQVLRSCADQLARSLKGKPAGPAGGEGGA